MKEQIKKDIKGLEIKPYGGEYRVGQLYVEEVQLIADNDQYMFKLHSECKWEAVVPTLIETLSERIASGVSAELNEETTASEPNNELPSQDYKDTLLVIGYLQPVKFGTVHEILHDVGSKIHINGCQLRNLADPVRMKDRQEVLCLTTKGWDMLLRYSTLDDWRREAEKLLQSYVPDIDSTEANIRRLNEYLKDRMDNGDDNDE